jgi:hypothetical protein
MPRKSGIFKQHQVEILELLKKKIGYTEIAEILRDKYGIKVTKQNLQQSHRRYLKTHSKKTRASSFKKTVSHSSQNVTGGAGNSSLQDTLKSVVHAPDKVAETLAFRERLPRIQKELEALLDAEAASGRFSDPQLALLRDWAGALFVLHPDTARDVFKGTFGSEFAAYRNAFETALKTISEKKLYCAFESRARPIEEETDILLMEVIAVQLVEEERKRRTDELQRAMKRHPELFTGTEDKELNGKV